MLSEAIDSLGSIPDLDISFNRRQYERNTTQLPRTVDFSGNCDLNNYLNPSLGSEKTPDFRITGETQTSYLRAMVWEEFRQGQWIAPVSQRSPYTGVHLSSGVETYLSRDSVRVTITPLLDMIGYLPAVLNLKTMDITAEISYDRELKIFHSSSPLR
jgi:hypothetical protein